MAEWDEAAVARARDGDTDAFRALVERHSRGVYRLALRITGNCHDAEDIVQETFLKVFRQLRHFESRASFGTWVHRIAANCAVDLLRSRPRRQEIKDEDAERTPMRPQAAGSLALSPERLMTSVEVSARVKDAMWRLSALERTAFVLRHLEGHSIAEIAGILGIGESAAKHCVFRAVRKMRIALEPFAG